MRRLVIASRNQHNRPGKVLAVRRHQGIHRPQDRRHQRRDYHRADDRRGRIGDDSGGGDDRRERQEYPVPAELPPDLRPLEQQLAAHAREIRFGDSRQCKPSLFRTGFALENAHEPAAVGRSWTNGVESHTNVCLCGDRSRD